MQEIYVERESDELFLWIFPTTPRKCSYVAAVKMNRILGRKQSDWQNTRAYGNMLGAYWAIWKWGKGAFYEMFQKPVFEARELVGAT